MVEAYAWLDLVRLAGYHDGESGYRFIYEDQERTPYAMQRDDGAVTSLFYDQVGSLRVVADMQGACDKCQALDGNHYKPGSEPERPHPNCKCKVVECYYGSDFGKWEKIKVDIKYEHADPVVFGYGLNTVSIWWTMTTITTYKRERTSFKLCGERKEVIRTITEYDTKEKVASGRSIAFRGMGSSLFTTTNPWTGKTSHGEITQSH